MQEWAICVTHTEGTGQSRDMNACPFTATRVRPYGVVLSRRVNFGFTDKSVGQEVRHCDHGISAFLLTVSGPRLVCRRLQGTCYAL